MKTVIGAYHKFVAKNIEFVLGSVDDCLHLKVFEIIVRYFNRFQFNSFILIQYQHIQFISFTATFWLK